MLLWAFSCIIIQNIRYYVNSQKVYVALFSFCHLLFLGLGAYTSQWTLVVSFLPFFFFAHKSFYWGDEWFTVIMEKKDLKASTPPQSPLFWCNMPSLFFFSFSPHPHHPFNRRWERCGWESDSGECCLQDQVFEPECLLCARWATSRPLGFISLLA